MTDPKTRALILKRRAKFIAAAVASAGMAASASTVTSCCPQTCLEPAIDTDAGPVVCLSVAPDLPDAGTDAVQPSVCLSQPLRPPRDG